MELASWLRGLRIVLVAADELHHETAQKDREQRGLPPGAKREVMPIAMQVGGWVGTQAVGGGPRPPRAHACVCVWVGGR